MRNITALEKPQDTLLREKNQSAEQYILILLFV